MPEPSYRYEGSELQLFAKAVRWKAYWGEIIKPYLGARVLEVGAGIGSTALKLCGSDRKLWVALEPDPSLAVQIRKAIAAQLIPDSCVVRVGTLHDLDEDEQFGSILYVDVLEHIKDDSAELERAMRLLSLGGFIIVLAPAHQHLFTPFDEAVGHFRRYDRNALLALTPQGTKAVRVDYLACSEVRDAHGRANSSMGSLDGSAVAPTRSTYRSPVRQISLGDMAKDLSTLDAKTQSGS
jgi:2-polyprenyl-3-methyl-5-hydroxy-6-metoxy-1,4-benzoquinol methylase